MLQPLMKQPWHMLEYKSQISKTLFYKTFRKKVQNNSAGIV